MSKTVVGLFSSISQAEQVKKTLVADGYDAQNIRVVANDEGETGSSSSTGSSYGTGSSSETGSSYATGSSSVPTASDSGYTDIGSGGGTGIGEKISSFFRNLTGGDEHTHHHYAQGVNSGGALLAATVDDSEADEVAATLEEYGARSVDEGNRQGAGSATSGAGSAMPAYGGTSTGSTTGASTASTTGETAIPVVEEELVVGKREVDRGGVRIYSHVTERPVDTDVTLREERINVERRPVNRPATAADFAAGTGSVVELNATGEEAVVGKTSRVVEEVLVGKESSERTEAIHDSVRKTEVEVENLPAESTTTRTDRF